jgi:hypothetical protein
MRNPLLICLMTRGADGNQGGRSSLFRLEIQETFQNLLKSVMISFLHDSCAAQRRERSAGIS